MSGRGQITLAAILRGPVLLVLVALPTNLTQRALAAIFGISQPTAHRAIRDLMATIADLFAPPSSATATP